MEEVTERVRRSEREKGMDGERMGERESEREREREAGRGETGCMGRPWTRNYPNHFVRLHSQRNGHAPM